MKLRTAEDQVSLQVDQVGDVVEVDDGARESLPANLTGMVRENAQPIYPLNEKLLDVLDPPRIPEV